MAVDYQQRARANAIERMDLVGSVENCDAIIVDDMIGIEL
jgi:phosphoribosylpyrophosphate synthetase